MPVWKRRYGFEVLADHRARSTCPPRPPATCSASPRRPWSTPAATPTPRRCRSRCARVGRRGRAARDRQRPRLRRTATRSAASEPGHLGLASMRERAELLRRRRSSIETSEPRYPSAACAPPLRPGSERGRRRDTAPGCRSGTPSPPAARGPPGRRWPAGSRSRRRARSRAASRRGGPSRAAARRCPGVISSVTLTGTVSAPDFDSSRASPPSSSPCAAASSGWMRSAWTRPPRISSGELCIHELCERSSRMPISRSGKLGSSPFDGRRAARSRRRSPAARRRTRRSRWRSFSAQHAGRARGPRARAVRVLVAQLGEAEPAAAQAEQVAVGARAQQQVGQLLGATAARPAARARRSGADAVRRDARSGARSRR